MIQSSSAADILPPMAINYTRPGKATEIAPSVSDLTRFGVRSYVGSLLSILPHVIGRFVIGRFRFRMANSRLNMVLFFTALTLNRAVHSFASTPSTPSILHGYSGNWQQVFYDDFSDPATLTNNYFHPFGDSNWRDNPANKWEWDPLSQKDIYWDSTASYIVNDAKGSRLRTCVYSDWFHRIDRLATKQMFGYGYYEATCRFKGAEGLNTAFWLLPETMDQSEIYPPGTIPGGIEVDIVEHRLKNGALQNIDQLGNTAIHWDGYGKSEQSVAYSEINLPLGPGQWCTYAVLHNETGVTWFWNGNEVKHTIVNSLSPAHIYFSSEVYESGGWAGNDMSSYGPRDNPAGYIEVKEVKFWSKKL